MGHHYQKLKELLHDSFTSCMSLMAATKTFGLETLAFFSVMLHTSSPHLKLRVYDL